MAKAQFFDGGIVLGLVASQIDGDRLEGYDQANLKLGMFIERKLKRRGRRYSRKGFKLNYGVELYYIGKGSSTKAKAAVTTAFDIQLHYIELSPYIVYEFHKKSIVQGGIAIASLLSNTVTHGLEENSSEDFNSLDLSYFIGYKYLLTKHFAIDTRLQRSVIPFASVDTSNPIYNQKGLINMILSFNLYYKL